MSNLTRPTGKLSKQRVIMHRGVSSAIDREGFIEQSDESGYVRSVSLARRDWADMGSPEVITVTIMPGDHLNPTAEGVSEREIDYADLVLLTRYMADEGGATADEIAYAVEKPWEHLDILTEARCAQGQES